MIDNTFILVSGPLHHTREGALRATGAIYHHIKGGGIYRKMGVAKYAGDKCAEELDGEPMSIYEHLWPHTHGFYVRPDSEFEEVVESGTPGYTFHPRFERQDTDHG